MLKSILAALLFTTLAACSFGGPPAQDKPDAAAAAPTTAAPAAQLQIIDKEVGKGREVQTGRAALVHYTGWVYDDKAPENKGKEFDTSANRGLPFGFIVGVGRVIKGWDQGILGMKVGGKRTLIIPPHLAYGEKGAAGGVIPANSTLVFDIELIEVKP
ncbi:MAG: FKBP-type peptidyl-prolyl cis-trans isomerase [Betaproteobacteria bacterium]|nr:FKBP-type peptidyl-prolyl cis-trans isomerase [Betaproteobacteria bacterium]